jgi:predicted amidohydrolase
MRLTTVLLWILAACVALPVKAADKPVRNRIVRVVTITQDGLDEKSKESLLEATVKRLDQAASFHPDIASLPETFLRDAAEPVPGPVTNRLGAWARAHSSYVIAGLTTQLNGRLYNSAILIDRQGRVAGQFHKIHPTEAELKAGITPGDTEPPVFETDFGTIGVQICFDVNWWDVWKRLKQKGAKIVFFPSAYPAARQISALALMNQFYVVSATQTRQSRIYDITGEELAASGKYQPWAGATLPIGKRLFEIDFHVRKVHELLQKYGSRIDVNWLHDDDWFTLASLDPGLTVEDLEQEFDLTPLDAYRVRATGAVDKARPK